MPKVVTMTAVVAVLFVGTGCKDESGGCNTEGCPPNTPCIDFSCDRSTGICTAIGIPTPECLGEDGGVGGAGGEGGAGGRAPKCLEWQEGEPLCVNGVVDPIEPCCEPQAPPDQPNACQGDESIENPSSCTAGGATVTYLVTQLEVLADCNVGYDLDDCFGHSCIRGGAAPAPGMNGVDNGLAGLAPIIAGATGDSGNLAPVNQWLADAICGKTEATSDEGCETEVPRLELRLTVSARPGENCANVVMSSGPTEIGAVAVNLSDDGCMSGTLPNITLELEETRVNLSNVTLRATVSERGLSDGLMGAAADAALDVLVARLFGGAFDGINQLMDINVDPYGDSGGVCNAISGTYAMGGIAE